MRYPHRLQDMIVPIAVFLPLLSVAGAGDAVVTQEGNWLTGEPAHGGIRLRDEGLSISTAARKDQLEYDSDRHHEPKLGVVSGEQGPGAGSEGEDVLFNLTLQLSGMDGPVPFVAYKGEDVLAKVRSVSRKLGLEPPEEARLAEAATEYAQAARAMPVRELSLGGSGPKAVRLQVFEGDKGPDLRERLLEAGVAGEEAEVLLEAALSQLQEERLAPVVMLKASWGTGLEQVISVFKDDDVNAVVRDFVARNSLDAEEAELLAKTVSTEAFRRRAVPMLVIPVEVPSADASGGPGAISDLKIYYGDNLGEAVTSFAAQRDLSDAAAASLLENAVKFAAKSGFVPFARHKPEFRGRQGEELPELQVWARDNATEAVRAYAEAHALEVEQEALLNEAVAQQAVAIGIVPVLSVGVNIRPLGSAISGDDKPLVVHLEVFEGDELEAAVDRFVKRYRMGSEGRSSLLERTRQVAEAERLVPLLTVSRVFPGSPDLEVSVPVFDGDDPAANAVVAARNAGLDEEQTEALAAMVVEEAKRARLLPAVVLLQEEEAAGVDEDSDEMQRPVFKLFFGDDISAKVQVFAAESALGAEEASDLLRAATLEATEAGVIPLLTVPITVSEEAATDEEEAPDASAAEGGGGGGGSTPVVRRLELFKGENIDAKVESFASEMRLDEASQALVRSHVVSVASKAGLLPAFTLSSLATSPKQQEQGPAPALSIPVEVSVDSGVSSALQHLEVFPGDNITAAVVKFGRRFGLSEEEIEELRALAVLRAQEARMVPLLSLPIELPAGEEGEATSIASLEMFQGETVPVAVREFLSRHGLENDASSTEALETLLREAAVDNRLLPEFEVPITAQAQEPGTVVEATFALFKGEDLGEAAARFVEDHGLGPSTLPKLLQFLQQQMAALAEAEAAAASEQPAEAEKPVNDELR